MLKNNLKAIRMKEYMMNKKEFAQHIGISDLQFLRYENGQNMPPLDKALAISYKLKRSCNEIWYLEQDCEGQNP